MAKHFASCVNLPKLLILDETLISIIHIHVVSPTRPPLQLQYKDTLQEGAALRVTFPHTEDGHVDLQVGVVIEAALKVLQPTQTSSTVDSFYRQQAWGVIQVRGLCVCGVIQVGGGLCVFENGIYRSIGGGIGLSDT